MKRMLVIMSFVAVGVPSLAVHVRGEGIASTDVPMPGGRKPQGCN